MIEFAVRDLDAVLKAAEARGAPVVTKGGVPVSTPDGPVVLVRDPDGYLIRLRPKDLRRRSRRQPLGRSSARESRLRSRARQPGSAFYRDLLRFEVHDRVPQPRASLVYGLDRGKLTETPVVIPGHRDGFDAPPVFRARRVSHGPSLFTGKFRTSARRSFSSKSVISTRSSGEREQRATAS